MNNGEARLARANRVASQRKTAQKRTFAKIDADWYDLMLTIAIQHRYVVVGSLIPSDAYAAMAALIRRGLVKNVFSTKYPTGYELTEAGLITLATHRADPIMDLPEEGMRDYYKRVGAVDLESIIRSVAGALLPEARSEVDDQFARVLAERAVHTFKYCAGSGFDPGTIEKKALVFARSFCRQVTEAPIA